MAANGIQHGSTGAVSGATPASPPRDTQVLLTVRGVALAYGSGPRARTVLADIDLDVARAEIVCIVGKSGCGKSTLLQIIAGLLPPSSGRVEIGGRRVVGPGGDRSMVFQDDAVFPWYTVRRNVEYGLRLAGVARGERSARAREAIRLVGLDGYEDHLPRQLSGGMRKRCDMARAIVMHPEILLMDEPFAALDVMTKQRLQAEFLTLCQDRRLTVIFVTHDLEEALLLGDRIVVMAGHASPLRKVVDVPFPRPRDAMLRRQPAFQALRFELASILGDGDET